MRDFEIRSNKSEYDKCQIKRFQKVLNDLFDNFIQDDGFICGGFARVCLEEKEDFKDCSDIDIYCKNIEAFDRIKDRFLSDLYIEDRVSPIAISLKYAFSGKYPIQLIKPFDAGFIHTSSESVIEVLNNFDFTITRAAIYRVEIFSAFDKTKKSYKLEAIADEDFFNSSNTLVIKNIHCPVAQVYRIAKYIKKGFTVRTMEIVKVLMDWENRPLQYKQNLIEALQKEDPTQEEIDKMEKLLHVD
jgi:hypothetical protein